MSSMKCSRRMYSAGIVTSASRGNTQWPSDDCVSRRDASGGFDGAVDARFQTIRAVRSARGDGCACRGLDGNASPCGTFHRAPPIVAGFANRRHDRPMGKTSCHAPLCPQSPGNQAKYAIAKRDEDLFRPGDANRDVQAWSSRVSPAPPADAGNASSSPPRGEARGDRIP